MNSDLLGELRRALEKMDEAGEFDGRFVVLFGANHPGDFAIRFLRERGASVRSVIDSNALNAGKALEGVAIGLPESVMLPFRDDALVLICSRHYAEMRGQLERMGYGPRHVRKLLNMGPQKADGGGAGAEAFEKAAARAAEGFSVYAALKAKYGEGARILITPVRSIGDAYAACAYLEASAHAPARGVGGAGDARAAGGARGAGDAWNVEDASAARGAGGAGEYVYVCLGEAGRALAGMFAIRNVYAATQREIDALTAFEAFAGIDGITVLQPFWRHTSFLHNMLGFRGIGFFDCMRHCCLGLSGGEKMRLPAAPGACPDAVARLFSAARLPKGSTAILSPCAHNFPALPGEFFERLAARLREIGLSVATNCGAPGEQPVAGTAPLRFPLEAAIQAAEYAGFFVGYRSGFCDLIHTARCRKLFVYPDKAYGLAKALDVFSVRQLGGGAWQGAPDGGAAAMATTDGGGAATAGSCEPPRPAGAEAQDLLEMEYSGIDETLERALDFLKK